MIQTYNPQPQVTIPPLLPDHYNQVAQSAIITLAKSYQQTFKQLGIYKAQVIGSYGRGTANPNSDLDVLVEYVTDWYYIHHVNTFRNILQQLNIQKIAIMSPARVKYYWHTEGWEYPHIKLYPLL